MAPCSANWKAWKPPPLLTAGPVFDAIAEENVCTKLFHGML
jgi:hypothetical protein